MELFGTPKDGTVTFTPGEKTYVLSQKSIGSFMPIEWLDKVIASLSSHENTKLCLSAYAEPLKLNLCISDNEPCYASTTANFDECGISTEQDLFFTTRLNFANKLYACLEKDMYQWSYWGTHVFDKALDKYEPDFEIRIQESNYRALIEKIGMLKRLIGKKEGSKIPKAFYAHNEGIVSFKIHEGIAVIAPDAFAFCSNLETIKFPSSLKRIEERAFSHCKKLQRIVFNEKIEFIDSYAFEYCKNLKEIVIAKTTPYIEDRAFYSCKNVCFTVDDDNTRYKVLENGTLLLSKDGETFIAKSPKQKAKDDEE